MNEYAAIFPVNARGDILLQLRDDRPDLRVPNTWSTLGGAIEAGETPAQAAARELLEECGRVAGHLVTLPPAVRVWPEDGMPFRVHYFATSVDWSPDDIILGEGQAMAWFAPDAMPSLRLSTLAPDIFAFAASPVRTALAASAPPLRDQAGGPLSRDVITALGIEPGSLVSLVGATAGFAGRLRALLPEGARLTASAAAHERPDVVLWWPRPDEVARPGEALERSLPAHRSLWVVMPQPERCGAGPACAPFQRAAGSLGLAVDRSLNLDSGHTAARLVDLRRAAGLMTP